MLKPEVYLRPHQLEAVRRTEKSNGNIILAHDVGSGKTLSALAAYTNLKSKGKAHNTLIVTPASLRENFGHDGVAKFTKDKYVIFGNKQEAGHFGKYVDVNEYAHRDKAKAEHHIVSYDLFKRDPLKYIQASGADTIIYDEIHRGKNEGTKITDIMRNVRPYHRNLIGLTGSVVSNTPADIVPLIDALTNGQHPLGSKESFEKHYLNKDKTVRDPALLRKTLEPYIQYVGLDDLHIAAPPKKEIHVINVPMSDYQTDLYRYALNKLDPITRMKLHSKIDEKQFKTIFNKLIGARQAANAIHTIDKNVSLHESALQSPKVKHLLDDVESHLKETKDGQVLVTSNLIQGGADVLAQGLKDRKIPFGMFLGRGNKDMSESQRQLAVARYNKGKNRVLIISSAGGEGLNLPNTTMVASLDGHFNPERINQMEARGIRSGGQSGRKPEDRHVIVNRYISVPQRHWLRRPMNVDKTIYDIAKRKAVANADLKGLFRLQKEQVQ